MKNKPQIYEELIFFENRVLKNQLIDRKSVAIKAMVGYPLLFYFLHAYLTKSSFPRAYA